MANRKETNELLNLSNFERVMSKGCVLKIVLVFVCLFGQVSAQEEQFVSKEVKPSLGLGIGFLNYYGDVSSIGNKSFLTNQFAYEFSMARKINKYSDLGFSFLTGTMIGNERSLSRNLNFRTDIYSVSVFGTIDLWHWLKWSNILHPYVTVGFESFEYNSKGDLVDENGTFYNYWDDGTIRDIDQQSLQANQANIMYRDYKYETDLRASNLDGFGTYPQLAIAVPVGIGVNMIVSDRLSFKIGSTFHYTFTDLIDNVSRNGEGVRKGNVLNDYFTFNSISIHYDLLSAPPSIDRSAFSFPDYFSVDVEDQDGDGIMDGFDLCPYTPKGVDVYENGCPVDDDEDGVPNYKDLDNQTLKSSFVNAAGKTLTDEDFQQQYLRYVDSAEIPIEILHKIAGEPEKARQYRVLLEEHSGEISEELAEKFLAEDDIIGSLNSRSQTAYLTKKYVFLEDAKARKEALVKKGFRKSVVVVWEGNTYYSIPEWEKKAKKELKKRFNDYYDNKEQLEGMYGIKLGETDASASTSDKVKYFDYEDVVVLKGDSGKRDYVIGPFIDKVGAKQALEKIDRSKFPGAELVTVKNQKTEPIGVEIGDVEPSLPVGSEDWNATHEKESDKRNLLDRLNNSLVLDFGPKDNPKTQKALNKIKSKIEVEEVVTKNGEIHIISKKPQAESMVRETVENFQNSGVDVAVKKIKNGSMFPVDFSQLFKRNQISLPKVGSGVLSDLEGGYTIDIGDATDATVQKFLKEINKIVLVDTVEIKMGKTRIIASELQTVDEAKKRIAKLKKLGINPTLVEVKNGDLIPVTTLPTKSKDELLAKKNGQIAISFGNPNAQTVKEARKKIEEKIDVAEVITASGEPQLISQPTITKEQAEKIVKEMQSQNIGASIVQIQNGNLKPVVPTINIQNNGDGPLEPYVINFGNKNNSKSEEIRTKIRSEIGGKEIKTATGETVFVADKPLTKLEAEAIAKKIKKEGFDVQIGKMIGDVFVQTKGTEKQPEQNRPIADATKNQTESEIKDTNPSKTDALENSYVVNLGTITKSTSLEEREKLVNAPNTLQIKNPDGSIDVVSTKPNKTEEEAYKEKAAYNTQGFSDAKVTFFKDGKSNAIRKEELEGKFTVSMGSFKTDVSNKEINKILSVPDVESIETFNPEMTTYIQGTYDSPEEARNSIEDLIKKGLEPSLVKVENGKIKNISVESVFDSETVKRLADLGDDAQLVKTDEILFRVQLGAYKQKIDLNIFRGVKTLSFPSSGGITKYVTGSFNSYQQAYISKLDMRKMGFNGSFIVAYKDGRRIKVTDLVNQEKFKQIKETLKPLENGMKMNTKSPNSVALPTPVVEEQETSASPVSYKVQVGAFKDGEEPLALSQFEEVEMEVYGQYKRYLTGGFKTYAEANTYKQELKTKGFPKAFIVAYNNGERVAAPGEESNVITKNDLSSTKASNTLSNYELSKVTIMVQVGLFRGDIPQELKGKYAGLPNLTKQVTAHGVTRYMTGNFKNISEAAAFKEELLKTGFPDAFLVSYYENSRVKVSEILEILKTAR